jgi:hypothetical protein
MPHFAVIRIGLLVCCVDHPKNKTASRAALSG